MICVWIGACEQVMYIFRLLVNWASFPRDPGACCRGLQVPHVYVYTYRLPSVHMSFGQVFWRFFVCFRWTLALWRLRLGCRLVTPSWASVARMPSPSDTRKPRRPSWGPATPSMLSFKGEPTHPHYYLCLSAFLFYLYWLSSPRNPTGHWSYDAKVS